MRRLVLVVAVIAGSATAASAGPDGLITAPTVIGVPTAWIQPAGAAHVLYELRATRPLSTVMAEQVRSLRTWAADRTVPAG